MYALLEAILTHTHIHTYIYISGGKTLLTFKQYSRSFPVYTPDNKPQLFTLQQSKLSSGVDN